MDGLSYFPELISAEEESALLSFLSESTDWLPVGSSEDTRRVLQFGYAYDYRNGSTTAPAPVMPELIRRLAQLDQSKTASEFDQCIVNRYLPGQGISFHVDSTSYGPVIACFSVGSGAEMEFRRGSERHGLYVEPRSLYVMEREARYEWQHSMRPRKKDNGVTRQTRYSLTFRRVRHD